MNCLFVSDGAAAFRCIECGRACPVLARRVCVKPRGDCLHRGEQTGVRDCASCGGNVRIKLFGCSVHSECTVAKQLDGVPCCASCNEFEPRV